MALSDWEVVYGQTYRITDERAVHGTHCLVAGETAEACGFVYKPTYNDAPLNAEIRSWFSMGSKGTESWCSYYAGMIARKQQGSKTYIELYLLYDVYPDGHIEAAEVILQTVHDGSPDLLSGEDVTSKLQNILGSHSQQWFWAKFKIYSMWDQIYGKAYITPYIDNPDVNNPPEDQLYELAEVVITQEPDYVKNGGACGIILGNKSSDTTWGSMYTDWTEIWY